MHVIADSWDDTDAGVGQPRPVDLRIPLDDFFGRLDAVAARVMRVVADDVDVDHQPPTFQGVADGVDVGLAVVLPRDERVVNLANLVGAPLPRDEPVQRLRHRQRPGEPAPAEPLAHAVDRVVNLGVVGEEDVFQQALA